MTKLQYKPEVDKYLRIIGKYEKEFAKWHERVQKIQARYKDESKSATEDSSQTKFNILWSNVQTLVPATFSKMPHPDVSRRFRDNDPVGRVASMILERALEFDLQHYSDFKTTMKYSVLDRFLGGRATAWVRYEPHVTMQESSSEEVTDEEPMEQLDGECAPIDYVHWKDFGHSVARTWEEVPQVWRWVYMTKEAVEDRFGEEIANKLGYDSSPDDDEKRELGGESVDRRARICEMWDKSTKKACWISKSYDDYLDVKDDPLGLEEYFPCPRPLFATITTDSLVPVPDFILYQDQANELNTISERIDGLINALKVRGVHNAEIKELGRLFTEAGNNDLIPVKAWGNFSEKGGLKGAIDIVDLTPIVNALQTAYEARKEVMDQIYSIMGIADIIRGESEAQETATAQGIKARFGSLRLRNTQEEVAQYATDLMKLKAQIMCGKFQDETLTSMASVTLLQPNDQAVVPQALQMLRGKVIRDFRIEVQADTLVQLDEEAEKSSRMEFLSTISGYLEKAVPAAQEVPQLAPLMVEMLKFAVTSFKAGKTLEGLIDTTLEQLNQQLAQNGGQKPPSPEIQKAQIEQQGKMQEMQGKFQLEQQKLAAEVQADREKAQIQMQVAEHKARMDAQVAQAQQQAQGQQAAQEMQLENQRDMLKAHNEQILEQMRMAMDAQTAQMQEQMKLLIAQIDNRAKIEVAEIGAQTTLDAAQISAASAGSDE